MSKHLICWLAFAIFLTIIGERSEAKVVLLTSFEKTREQKIVENSFRKNIKAKNGQNSVEVEIINQATQWELFQVLQDPTLEGIFWVSHGLTAPTPVPGSRILPKLLDYRGDNVAPVFSLASPRLNFLAIIGCNSAAILADIGVHEMVRGRSYVSTDRHASATSEIQKAINAFRTLPPQATPDEILRPRFGSLRITRSIPGDADPARLRSIRIVVGGQVVGVMAAPIPGTQREELFSVTAGNGFEVKLESGENIQDPKGLGVWGDVSVDSRDIRGHWELFTDGEGNPLGVNQRLFLYHP